MNIKKIKSIIERMSPKKLVGILEDVLEEIHDEVIYLRDKEKYEEALQIINRTSSNFARYMVNTEWLNDMLYHKGEVLFALGRVRESLNAFNKILSYNPRDVDALYMKGWILSDLGRHKEAMIIFRNTLKSEPNDSDILVNLSHELLTMNKFAEALKTALKAARINKKDDVAWYNAGEAYHGMSKYQSALQMFEKVLNINRKDDEAWYMKARCMSLLSKNQKDVLGALRVAVSLNKENKLKAKKEKDFLPLRKLGDFQKLLK
ncbi:MAG: hypothetical protein D4R72_07740 [Nitrosopumilales archaeon]|nr:MAG: hypothetical protein D4R72_07740 [Nitrosopumilales archaeon]